MSESIQSSSPFSSAPQNTKMVLLTTVITAMTTVAVSFVGVVPQLRGHDTGKIASLTEEVERLKKNAAPAQKADAVVPPGKKKTITGTVWSQDGQHPMGGVDVFLLPTDGPRLTDNTDGNGKFVLSDIPPGVYSIIVREPNGKSIKTYLYEDENQAEVLGTLIKYRISDKGDR